jgi:hypothetical protein
VCFVRYHAVVKCMCFVKYRDVVKYHHCYLHCAVCRREYTV